MTSKLISNSNFQNRIADRMTDATHEMLLNELRKMSTFMQLNQQQMANEFKLVHADIDGIKLGMVSINKSAPTTPRSFSSKSSTSSSDSSPRASRDQLKQMRTVLEKLELGWNSKLESKDQKVRDSVPTGSLSLSLSPNQYVLSSPLLSSPILTVSLVIALVLSSLSHASRSLFLSAYPLMCISVYV
jgi:hypothetical protein